MYMQPVAPVAYQVILEASIGRFGEFVSPRVHTRIKLQRTFLVHESTCRKRKSMS